MTLKTRQLVFVVDDVAGNRILAEAFLTRIGWGVELYADAEAALARMESQWPDAMLIDVRMPGRNGDELAKLLRTRPRGKTLRLVGYTAHALPDELTSLRNCGFDEILVKPALYADLRRALPLEEFANGTGVRD